MPTVGVNGHWVINYKRLIFIAAIPGRSRGLDSVWYSHCGRCFYRWSKRSRLQSQNWRKSQCSHRYSVLLLPLPVYVWHSILPPPSQQSGKGNVFSSVCLSFGGVPCTGHTALPLYRPYPPPHMFKLVQLESHCAGPLPHGMLASDWNAFLWYYFNFYEDKRHPINRNSWPFGFKNGIKIYCSSRYL